MITVLHELALVNTFMYARRARRPFALRSTAQGKNNLYPFPICLCVLRAFVVQDSHLSFPSDKERKIIMNTVDL